MIFFAMGKSREKEHCLEWLHAFPSVVCGEESMMVNVYQTKE